LKNKYRLSAKIFERETEDEKLPVTKVIFLSVEGNVTEKEYFEGISRYRERLGINAKVNVEVLKRSGNDTNSAPQQVIELLEEYLQLRENGQEDLIDDIPQKFIDQYGVEFIKKYLENTEDISKKERNIFKTELIKIGYDVEYRKYLRIYNNNLDEFAILIDRDMQTHSEVNMMECINHCKEKGYHCYIANPCFEFWLLLHLSDVKEEYKDNMEEIKNNKKVSRKHTYVSKEVSDKAHHSKGGIGFNNNYLPKVDDAIQRAKEFASDEEDLIYEIGCNVWKMLEGMKAFEN
jgi:hypothetical protein